MNPLHTVTFGDQETPRTKKGIVDSSFVVKETYPEWGASRWLWEDSKEEGRPEGLKVEGIKERREDKEKGRISEGDQNIPDLHWIPVPSFRPLPGPSSDSGAKTTIVRLKVFFTGAAVTVTRVLTSGVPSVTTGSRCDRRPGLKWSVSFGSTRVNVFTPRPRGPGTFDPSEEDRECTSWERPGSIGVRVFRQTGEWGGPTGAFGVVVYSLFFFQKTKYNFSCLYYNN